MFSRKMKPNDCFPWWLLYDPYGMSTLFNFKLGPSIPHISTLDKSLTGRYLPGEFTPLHHGKYLTIGGYTMCVWRLNCMYIPIYTRNSVKNSKGFPGGYCLLLLRYNINPHVKLLYIIVYDSPIILGMFDS